MSTTWTHTAGAKSCGKLGRLALRTGLALALTAAWACSVGVPDPHQLGFACKSDSDCIGGYSCQLDSGGINRVCTQGSCGCTYPFICKSNPSGGGSCAQCSEVGCGPNENCVRSNFGTAQSRCVPSCSAVNAACTATGNSGWCVVVPGWVGTASSTVQACSTCGGSCTSCTANPGFTSFDGATSCTTGGSNGCKTTGCGPTGSCVAPATGAPICYTSCTGGTCGPGAVCVTVNTAYTSSGASTSAQVCIPCPSACGTCTAVSPVNYVSEAAPTCGGAGGNCSPSSTCKDLTLCSSSGTCADGTGCNAASACGAGQMCTGTGVCASAACTSDSNCPTSYYCGLRRVCGYSTISAPWYPLGSSDTVSLMNAFTPSGPALQMGNDGLPVVAYVLGGKVYVIRYSAATASWSFINRPGLDFVNQPTGAATANAQFTAALVLDGGNQPTVAWNENNTAVYVKHWNGTDWTTYVGGGFDSSSGNGVAVPGGTTVGNVALSMYNGQPMVAWTQKDSSSIPRVYVRYFTSTGSWVDFPGSGSGIGLGGTLPGPVSIDSYPANADVLITFADGIAGASRFVRVFRSMSGSGFTELPQRNSAFGDALTPVAGHGSGGQPLIAWVNNFATGNSLSVEQLSGGNIWSSLAFTSTASSVATPSISRDVDGNVVVAFSGVTGGGTGIHARGYTGGGWVDLHYGDGDLGMSVNSGISATMPSVGASTRTCVAFLQASSLYLRCHP